MFQLWDVMFMSLHRMENESDFIIFRNVSLCIVLNNIFPLDFILLSFINVST